MFIPPYYWSSCHNALLRAFRILGADFFHEFQVTSNQPCCCCCCQVASVLSDSVRPQRQQPTRLPRLWDSLGKNTGVGCHFLLQCMKVKSQSEVAQSCLTPSDLMDCSLPGSSIHGFSRQEYWSGVPLTLEDAYYQVTLHTKSKPLKVWIVTNPWGVYNTVQFNSTKN